ncbi:MAG: DinB family protein [Gemmatimonadaceae bacterium]
MLQRELHELCKADIASVRERLVKAVRPLDGGQLNERPEPVGWSIGEVLEHLCVSDGVYEPKMKQLILTARRDAAAPNREWKPSFLGGLITRGLQGTRKVRTFKVFEPGATPRGGVLEAFLAMQQSVLTMMNDAETVDWNKVRIASAVMPWFAPKMNLGDAFRIHAVHAVRHTAQVERLAGRLSGNRP